MSQFPLKPGDQLPLPLKESTKRLCVHCRKRKVYLDIKTMDYCEPCIWNMVKKDMKSLGTLQP
jgi:hypothetical protein